MSSRRTEAGAERTYAAAEAWVNCALRNDDSLFTPGEAIWTPELLGDLRARTVDRPDVGGSGFFGKLKGQLAGSPVEVRQLMAETLYFFYLIVHEGQVKPETKLSRIEEVLNQQLAVPEHLVGGLKPGFVNMGGGISKGLPYFVGFIIEFAEQWKALGTEQRQHILNNPWNFEEFASGLEMRGELFKDNSTFHKSQNNALLHLVFPDYFERITSVPQKSKLIKVFEAYVDDSTASVDGKIYQIRACIQTNLGRDFDFFDDDVRKLWRPFGNEDFDDISESEVSELGEGGEHLPDFYSLAQKLYMPDAFLEEVTTLLEDKKQVIFQGPPGTGKTYVAQALAECLAGSKKRVTLVQFHPSYAYEDFVQGYRPTLQDGHAGFELRDGPLLRAANNAKAEPEAKHFLLIDEINRGNLAKVFGELYFLLEYRDQEIRLQYSDEDFSLPENLYIIGTMNTADRSIALVDMALRRRFYFVEFHPDKEPVKGLLRRYLKESSLETMEWVADVVDRANGQLGDDRHAVVGPSHFMKPDLNDAMVERIWEHGVLPYIEERVFGRNDDRTGDFALDKLRGLASGLASVVDGH